LIISDTKIDSLENEEPTALNSAISDYHQVTLNDSQISNSNNFHNTTNNNSINNLNSPSIIITSNNSKKISRDSLIHKIDVFQFDDVDSIHTHDSLIYKVQSSFELDEEDDENLDEEGEAGGYKEQKNKTKRNDKKHKKNYTDSSGNNSANNKTTSKLIANFITPLIRKSSTKRENHAKKMDENVQKNLNRVSSGSSFDKTSNSAFSKHLSSLKRLIVKSDVKSAASMQNLTHEKEHEPPKTMMIKQSSDNLNLIVASTQNSEIEMLGAVEKLGDLNANKKAIKKHLSKAKVSSNHDNVNNYNNNTKMIET
jgi:hypothetical protein